MLEIDILIFILFITKIIKIIKRKHLKEKEI